MFICGLAGGIPIGTLPIPGTGGNPAGGIPLGGIPNGGSPACGNGLADGGGVNWSAIDLASAAAISS